MVIQKKEEHNNAKKTLKNRPLQKEDGKRSIKNKKPKNRTIQRLNKNSDIKFFNDTEKKTKKLDVFTNTRHNKKINQQGGESEEDKARILSGFNYITKTSSGINFGSFIRDFRAELKGMSIINYTPTVFSKKFPDIWGKINALGIRDENRQRMVKLLQVMEVAIFYLNYVFALQLKMRSILAKMERYIEDRVINVFNCQITHDDLLEGKKGFFSRVFSSSSKATIDQTTSTIQPTINKGDVEFSADGSQAGGSKNLNNYSIAAALSLTNDINENDMKENDMKENDMKDKELDNQQDFQLGGGSVAEQVFLYGKSFGIVGPNDFNFGETKNIGNFAKVMSVLLDRERRSYSKGLKFSAPGQGKFLRSYINYLHLKIQKYQGKVQKGIKPLIKAQTKLKLRYKLASDIIYILPPQDRDAPTTEEAKYIDTLKSSARDKLIVSPELKEMKAGLMTFFNNFEKDYQEIVRRFDVDLKGFWVQDNYGRIIHNLYNSEGETTRELDYLMNNIDITGYDSQIAQNIFSNVYQKVANKDLKFRKTQPKQTYFEVRKIAQQVLAYSRCLVQAQLWDDFAKMQGFSIDIKKMETPDGIKKQCIGFTKIDPKDYTNSQASGLLHKIIIADENIALFSGKRPNGDDYRYAAWSNKNQEAGLNGLLSYGSILGYYDNKIDELGIPEHPYITLLAEQKRLALISSAKSSMKETMTREKSQLVKQKGGANMQEYEAALQKIDQALRTITPEVRQTNPDEKKRYLDLRMQRDKIIAEMNMLAETTAKQELAIVNKDLSLINAQDRATNQALQERYLELISIKNKLTNQLANIEANKKLKLSSVISSTKTEGKYKLIIKRRFLDVNKSKEQMSWFDVWRLHMYENFYVFSSLLDSYMNHDLKSDNQPPALFQVTPDFFYRFYQTEIHETFVKAFTVMGLYDLIYRSFITHMKEKINIEKPDELAKYKFVDKLPLIGSIAQQLYAYPLLVDQKNNINLFHKHFHERLKVAAQLTKSFSLDYYNTTVLKTTPLPAGNESMLPTEDLESFPIIKEWFLQYFRMAQDAFIFQTEYDKIFATVDELIVILQGNSTSGINDDTIPRSLESLTVGQAYVVDQGKLVPYTPQPSSIDTSAIVTPPVDSSTRVKKTKWGHHLFTAFFDPKQEFKKPDDMGEDEYKLMLVLRNPIVTTNIYKPFKDLVTESNKRGIFMTFLKGKKLTEALTLLTEPTYREENQKWDEETKIYNKIRTPSGATPFEIDVNAAFSFYLGNNLNDKWIETQSRFLLHYLYASQVDDFIIEILKYLETPQTSQAISQELMKTNTETKKFSKFYENSYSYFVQCVTGYLEKLKEIEPDRLESYFNVDILPSTAREFDLIDFLNMLILTMYVPILPKKITPLGLFTQKIFEVDSLDDNIENILSVRLAGLGDLKIKSPANTLAFGTTKGGSMVNVVTVKKTLRRPIKNKTKETNQTQHKGDNQRRRPIKSKKLLRYIHGGAVSDYQAGLIPVFGEEQDSAKIASTIPSLKSLKYYFGKNLKSKISFFGQRTKSQILTFLNLKLSKKEAGAPTNNYVLFRIFQEELQAEMNKYKSEDEASTKAKEEIEKLIKKDLTDKMTKSYKKFVSYKKSWFQSADLPATLAAKITEARNNMAEAKAEQDEINKRYDARRAMITFIDTIKAFMDFPDGEQVELGVLSRAFVDKNKGIQSKSHNNYKFFTENSDLKVIFEDAATKMAKESTKGVKYMVDKIKNQIDALINVLKDKITPPASATTPAPTSSPTSIPKNKFFAALDILGFNELVDKQKLKDILGENLDKATEYTQPFEKEANKPVFMSKMDPITSLVKNLLDDTKNDSVTIFQKIFNILGETGAVKTGIVAQIAEIVKAKEVFDNGSGTGEIPKINTQITDLLNTRYADVNTNFSAVFTNTNLSANNVDWFKDNNDKLSLLELKIIIDLLISTREKAVSTKPAYPANYTKLTPLTNFSNYDNTDKYTYQPDNDVTRIRFLKDIDGDIDFFRNLLNVKIKKLGELYRELQEKTNELEALKNQENQLNELKDLLDSTTNPMQNFICIRNEKEMQEIDDLTDHESKLFFIKSYLKTLRTQLILIKFDFLKYNQEVNQNLFMGPKGQNNIAISLETTSEKEKIYAEFDKKISKPGYPGWKFDDDNMRIYNHILREWTIADYNPKNEMDIKIPVGGQECLALLRGMNKSIDTLVKGCNELLVELINSLYPSTTPKFNISPIIELKNKILNDEESIYNQNLDLLLVPFKDRIKLFEELSNNDFSFIKEFTASTGSYLKDTLNVDSIKDIFTVELTTGTNQEDEILQGLFRLTDKFKSFKTTIDDANIKQEIEKVSLLTDLSAKKTDSIWQFLNSDSIKSKLNPIITTLVGLFTNYNKYVKECHAKYSLDIDTKIILLLRIFILCKEILEEINKLEIVTIAGTLQISNTVAEEPKLVKIYTNLLKINILSIFAKIYGIEEPTVADKFDDYFKVENFNLKDYPRFKITMQLKDTAVKVPHGVINAVKTLSAARQFDNPRLNKILKTDTNIKYVDVAPDKKPHYSESKFVIPKSLLKSELSNVTQGYPYYYQLADKLFELSESMKEGTAFFNPTTPEGNNNLKAIGFEL